MPALVLLSAVEAKWAWESGSWPRRPYLEYTQTLTAIVLVTALVGVYSVEANLRLKSDSQASLWQLMQAPSER